MLKEWKPPESHRIDTHFRVENSCIRKIEFQSTPLHIQNIILGVLLSESLQELQLMVEELRTASNEVGLEINLDQLYSLDERVSLQSSGPSIVCSTGQVSGPVPLAALHCMGQIFTPCIMFSEETKTTSLPEDEGIRPMCRACTDVWASDLRNYRQLVKKIRKFPIQYEKKDHKCDLDSRDHCCSGATLKFAYMLQVFSFPFYTVKTNVAFEQQFGKPGYVDQKIKLAP
ncbi:hypothetical protein GQR58_013342 [Nymphon striatum]|nr:hypothetical protein GQR58_013342 [Nymphon striatum]